MNSNIIITRPTAEEYKKSIKMLNKIFMLNFSRLLPKLYGKGKDYSKDHFIVKEEGKIVAAIASVPTTFFIDNETLKVRGVGMVGTKYSSRGKGIMTLMLERIYKEAMEDDTDMLFLSGNFNRYNRFGFYPSGINNIYKIRKNKSFIKDARDYTFTKIKGNNLELGKIESIYDELDVKWQREDFYQSLHNWHQSAYLIYKNNELKGYLVTKGKSHIFEINTINSNIVEVLTAWLCQIGRDSVKVEINPYLSETNSQLLDQCDGFIQSSVESWSILNWQNVLEKLLNAKLRRQPLRKGKVVIAIDEEKYQIDVQESIVKVTTTTKESDVILTKGMATRIFFGVNEMFKTGSELLDSWLPVPIYISACDTM